MNLRFVFGDIHPGAAEVTAGQRGGEGEFQLMLSEEKWREKAKGTDQGI